MRKRLLLVSTSSTRGGAEKILYTLAKNLSREKFDIASFVSLKSLGIYGDLLKKEGLAVESLETDRQGFFPAISALRSILENKRPDIVLAFMYQAVQLCRLIKLLSPVSFKLISSHRVNPRTRSFLTLLADRALKSQDNLTVAECEASRSFLVKNQGYPEKQVKVIYNGIAAVERNWTQEEKAALRRTLNVKENSFLIGSAGRLHKQKNHAALIDAVSLLQAHTNIQCVIFGEGPERVALEIQIKTLGLKDKVILMGEKESASSFFPALDAFVLSSSWEGFPSVILEAMEAQTPVIATSVDGVPEIIQEGFNGFMVPPQNPKALANAIARLIDFPKDSRIVLVKNAYKSVLNRFSLTRMIESYENIFLES